MPLQRMKPREFKKRYELTGLEMQAARDSIVALNFQSMLESTMASLQISRRTAMQLMMLLFFQLTFPLDGTIEIMHIASALNAAGFTTLLTLETLRPRLRVPVHEHPPLQNFVEVCSTEEMFKRDFIL